jgi:hypothetical protein
LLQLDLSIFKYLNFFHICIIRQNDYEEIIIKQKKKEKSNAWKKSVRAKKPKVSYKTADEIINEIGSEPSVRPIKIIDMTGPQV